MTSLVNTGDFPAVEEEQDLDEEEEAEPPSVAERLKLDDKSPFLLVANADVSVGQERQDYRRKCLHWLQQAREEQAAAVRDDPLFQARQRLTFASGVPANDDHRIYDEAIDVYVEQGRGPRPRGLDRAVRRTVGGAWLTATAR